MESKFSRLNEAPPLKQPKTVSVKIPTDFIQKVESLEENYVVQFPISDIISGTATTLTSIDEQEWQNIIDNSSKILMMPIVSISNSNWPVNDVTLQNVIFKATFANEYNGLSTSFCHKGVVYNLEVWSDTRTVGSPWNVNLIYYEPKKEPLYCIIVGASGNIIKYDVQ